MKQLLFTAMLTWASVTMFAQAAASPAAKLTQTVGTTEITVVYSRPAMKGRQIFGTLVPFDQVWRTGANSATKISFAKDVTIEGQALKAGDYALNTTPGKDSWKIHIHTFDQPGAGSYNGKTPVLTVTVKPSTSASKVESFMFSFDNLKADGGDLFILWDNVSVPVKIGAM
jgi:hypothetical protein